MERNGEEWRGMERKGEEGKGDEGRGREMKMCRTWGRSK